MHLLKGIDFYLKNVYAGWTNIISQLKSKNYLEKGNLKSQHLVKR